MPSTLLRPLILCPALLALLVGCRLDGEETPPPPTGGTSNAHFFLPTGEPDNTAAPSLVTDATGGLHAVYPAYAGGGAYYAYCGAGCQASDDVQVVRIDTAGTVGNAMIALDANDHPQLLLSSSQTVIYASCMGSCTDPNGWSTAEIIHHGGDREVTGEAFALDAAGRPRFVMHTYVAYLGIGQKAPETHYVTCDDGCLDPGAWTVSKIADQIWRSGSLVIDHQGVPHLGTVALVEDPQEGTQYVAAYATCPGDCTRAEAWLAHGISAAFQNELDAVATKPAVSLALTQGGGARLAMLGEDTSHQRRIEYWACDGGCADSDWRGSILLDGQGIGAGIDLALDAADHPRFAYTYDYNIFLAHCDEGDCTLPDAAWGLSRVEAGEEMPPDEIFLYPNCTVAAWFLHSPSLALTPSGLPRVGYQARDISGGWNNPDPVNTPDCVAGTDMTWSRLTTMSAL
ncbi:MAG: hypothetical protein R3B72_12175 [Polyangiaceae bacterium]